VAIIGFDAIPDALDNIRSGRLLGSVAQFPSEMGRLGVQTAVALMRNGVQPPAEILTKVEIIDLNNLASFEGATGSDGSDEETP
jgi:ABC-type sugar transport system substrate-binding protein